MMQLGFRASTSVMVCAAFVAFSAAGCGKMTDGALVGGMPAVNYYQSLSYQNDGVQNAHSSKFLAPPDGQQFVLQNLSGGKKIYADFALFLRQNRQFTFIYDESVGCSNGQGILKEKIDHKVVQGYWMTSGSSLMLPQVGTGAGGAIGSFPGVTLSFSRDFGRRGLSGKNSPLQYKEMSSNLEDNAYGGFVTDYDTAVQILDSSHACVNK